MRRLVGLITCLTLSAGLASTIALGQPAVASPALPAPDSGPSAVGFEAMPIVNGSFTDGVSGWSPTMRVARLATTSGGHGDRHAIAVRSLGRGADLISTAPAVPDPHPGSTYRVALWVRATAPGPSTILRLVADDTDGRPVWRGSQALRLPDTRWHELHLDHEASAEESQLRLRLLLPTLRPGKAVTVDGVTAAVSTPTVAPTAPVSSPTTTPAASETQGPDAPSGAGESPVPAVPSAEPSTGPSTEPPTEPPNLPAPDAPADTASPTTPVDAGAPPAAQAYTWLSGASGDGVTDGSFGTWRQRPVAITGTWNDNAESQPGQPTLRTGYALGAWQGSVDDAVGGIYKPRGDTWAAAAEGAYDDRWRVTLRTLASEWRDRPGTLYLRFAHEFNGAWEPWSVSGAEADDFKTAWRRFRALQREIVPQAELVFCPSADTSRSLDLDWRQAFPGAGQVDATAVDYYNQYPFVRTAGDFDRSIQSVDDHGAPRGLEAHRAFAERVGLPFAVPEWSSNAAMGDSPVFMERFYGWLSAHAGTGPGQLLYEIQFNRPGHDEFHLYPATNQAGAADAYRALW